MKTTAHIAKEPPAACGVRVLRWLKRHPEVVIAACIGIILTLVLVVVLRQQIERGLLWLFREVLAFLKGMIDSFDRGTKG